MKAVIVGLTQLLPGLFRRRRELRVPTILGAELAECGLVCLTMVVNAYGLLVTLADMRARFSVSTRGLSLRNLIEIAGSLGLTTRACRAELNGLKQLQYPCILHWQMEHFVVLVGYRQGQWLIHDPAAGQRTLDDLSMSRGFTGIVLECRPGERFVVQARVPRKPWLRNTLTISGVRPFLPGMFALLLAIEFCALFGPWLGMWAVDEAIPALDMQRLWVAMLAFFAVSTLQLALGLAKQRLLTSLQQLWGGWTGAVVFDHLIRLPVAFFDVRSTGEIASRMDGLDQLIREVGDGWLNSLLDATFGVLILGVFVEECG